ncbi:MAG: hypothetical protein ACK4K9_09730 [Bacteroidia bacterium]
MKKLILVAAYVLAIMATSCKKDLNSEFEQMVEKSKSEKAQKTNTLNDAKISQNFDWKTTKDVSITLTGYANSMVKITTLDGTLVDNLRIKTNEAYTTVVNIPTSENQLVVYYMGQQIVLDVNSPKVNYIFN